ncbi:MAG TPA: YfhO family protein, partial [Gemmatimonadales bacterium]|nr:YfhO family protein [Gemmatimonadales bacterium]
MAAETAPALNGPYEPRHPTLTALGFFAIWIAILSLPMLSGKWLAGPYSDQFPTGYATRTWAAEEIRRTGALPAWDPHMFGGIPFVAGQHGDIFYLTSALRVVLPTSTAMNLGFVIHYLLAGLFTYLLLRRLKVSWTGALVGGLAYQLSGLIASYPSPGHDGKLFVSTWFPLALLALVMAIRERRWEGYGLLAFCVGVSLLSPHYQMTYYLLIASGLFALYLAFGEPGAEPVGPRIGRLGLALGAVLVGFGIAMIQIMPFFEYLPYSPRAESYGDFARSASYAIPWNHVPELFLSEFVGRGETYWGSNPLKYHSEYLGLPVVALAVLGMAGSPRRRLTWWLGGIGLLFLLISLGGSTPFYRLWWSVMPYVKQTRAPGMAFFVVAFVMAVFAAAGVERLERGEGKSAARIWLAIGAAVGLIALVGGWGGLAESLARAGEPDPMGRPLSSIAAGAGPAIRWGAFGSGAALAVVAGLALAWGRRRLVAPVFAGALALAV